MTRWLATWGLLWLAAGPGCSGDRPLASCADGLTGVWRGEDGTYHLTDSGDRIEIYAMFDTARPPTGDKASSPEVYAPVVFDLTRVTPPGGPRLTGTRSQRVERDGVACPIRVPAEITDCRGDRITLRYELDRGVDWDRCRTQQTGRWRALTLRRE